MPLNFDKLKEFLSNPSLDSSLAYITSISGYFISSGESFVFLITLLALVVTSIYKIYNESRLKIKQEDNKFELAKLKLVGKSEDKTSEVKSELGDIV